MNAQQELAYLESQTNHLTRDLHNRLNWGLQHLEPFTSETGRPPMTSFDYIMMFETQRDLGERNGETINHIKEDFDINHRIVKIYDPKTAKGGYQKTTITPRFAPILENYLKRFSNSDRIWDIDRQNAWRYAKDAGRLAGIDMFEEHEKHDIVGMWTHAFRKACSKDMQAKGASRELRMLKLRHSLRDAHDAYDKVDLNALLKWEWENCQ